MGKGRRPAWDLTLLRHKGAHGTLALTLLRIFNRLITCNCNLTTTASSLMDCLAGKYSASKYRNRMRIFHFFAPLQLERASGFSPACQMMKTISSLSSFRRLLFLFCLFFLKHPDPGLVETSPLSQALVCQRPLTSSVFSCRPRRLAGDELHVSFS